MAQYMFISLFASHTVTFFKNDATTCSAVAIERYRKFWLTKAAFERKTKKGNTGSRAFLVETKLMRHHERDVIMVVVICLF